MKYERIRISGGVDLNGHKMPGRTVYAKNPTLGKPSKLLGGARLLSFEAVDLEGVDRSRIELVDASLVTRRTVLRMNPIYCQLEDASKPLVIPEWVSPDLERLARKLDAEAAELLGETT